MHQGKVKFKSHGISLKAEIAVPQFCVVVNLTVGIEDGTTIGSSAQYWLVHEWRKVITFLEWLIETRKRND